MPVLVYSGETGFTHIPISTHISIYIYIYAAKHANDRCVDKGNHGNEQLYGTAEAPEDPLPHAYHEY